jgi:transaldolase
MENLLRKKGINVGVFGDGGNLRELEALVHSETVDGLTTNPSLLAASGVSDYQKFANELLEMCPTGFPLSFEVLSDEPDEVESQAVALSRWSEGVYVKVPIVNSRGESLLPTIRSLSDNGIKVNVTAVMTFEQIDSATQTINPQVPAYISVFAGRIADTGRDPSKTIKHCVQAVDGYSKTKVIWASAREILNAVQAAAEGCHYITLPKSILDKAHLFDKDLTKFSQETAKMFIDDAKTAGLEL